MFCRIGGETKKRSLPVTEPLDWVTLDAENLSATVLGLPGASDISLPVDVNTVVEFLSR